MDPSGHAENWADWFDYIGYGSEYYQYIAPSYPGNLAVTAYQNPNSNGIFTYVVTDNGNVVASVNGESAMASAVLGYCQAYSLDASKLQYITYDKSCYQYPSGAYDAIFMLGMSGVLGGLFGPNQWSGFSAGTANSFTRPGGISFVDPNLANKWYRSTSSCELEAMMYHYRIHGKGMTVEEYTNKAMNFYNQNKGLGVDVTLKDLSKGIRIRVGDEGGYYTPDGRIVSYWDDKK